MSDLQDMSADRPELLLSVRGLAKSFPTAGRGPLDVLKSIDLDVHRGEVVAIVGESGTGKSTLLHILGTLEQPDSGDIRFSGEILAEKDDEALSLFRNTHVGFVFQFHHLLPEFTAQENVMMPALVRGDSPNVARPRANELLTLLGLSDRSDHRPGELSGGERQRVAMARALMNAPDLVLADEPTGNLDEKTADQLHNELIRLSREMNQTFVLVTHNQGFAAMADRILVLEQGKLVEQAR